MKVVFFFFAVVLVAVLAAPEEKYTDQYDSIDIDEILKNKILVKNYCGCLQGKKPCTADGAELKKNLPDALKTECSKCSKRQKTESRKVIHHLIDNEPKCWEDLEAIYDKDGEYRKKYQAQAEKEGIKI